MIATANYRKKLLAIQPLAAEAAARLNRTVVTDEQHEPPPKWCNKCKSSLPATDDFFYHTVNGRLHSPCKACIIEQKQAASAVKPCAVPGCEKPRHHSRNGHYYSYCVAHNKAMKQKKASTIQAVSP